MALEAVVVNRYKTFLGLLVFASLAGCVKEPKSQDYQNGRTDVKAIQVGEKAFRCLPENDIGVTTTGYELTGDLRAKFLTPEARLSSVRVWVSGIDVTNYGSTKITYTDHADSCVIWTEGLTLQEYSERLELNPVGLSPFYSADTPKSVTYSSSSSPTEPSTPLAK